MKKNNSSFATGNKWIADIPMSTITDDICDTSLNLVSFSIPDIEISSDEFPIGGENIALPTGVINQSNKEITFTYKVSGDFSQYINLWKWVSLASNVNPIIDVEPKPIVDGTGEYFSATLPVRVYLLSEFKKEILSLKYENAWISNFSSLELDYSNDQSPIEHSFTLKYSKVLMETL
jgi:hypothetical protein